MPADFNLCWYIDERHYLEEDTTPNLVHEEKIKISSLKYVQNIIPENFCDFEQKDIILVKILIDIEAFEEGYFACGSSYIFAAVPNVSWAWKLGLFLKSEHFCLGVSLVYGYYFLSSSLCHLSSTSDPFLMIKVLNALVLSACSASPPLYMSYIKFSSFARVQWGHCLPVPSLWPGERDEDRHQVDNKLQSHVAFAMYVSPGQGEDRQSWTLRSSSKRHLPPGLWTVRLDHKNPLKCTPGPHIPLHIPKQLFIPVIKGEFHVMSPQDEAPGGGGLTCVYVSFRDALQMPGSS